MIFENSLLSFFPLEESSFLSAFNCLFSCFNLSYFSRSVFISRSKFVKVSSSFSSSLSLDSLSLGLLTVVDSRGAATAAAAAAATGAAASDASISLSSLSLPLPLSSSLSVPLSSSPSFLSPVKKPLILSNVDFLSAGSSSVVVSEGTSRLAAGVAAGVAAVAATAASLPSSPFLASSGLPLNAFVNLSIKLGSAGGVGCTVDASLAGSSSEPNNPPPFCFISAYCFVILEILAIQNC